MSLSWSTSYQFIPYGLHLGCCVQVLVEGSSPSIDPKFLYQLCHDDDTDVPLLLRDKALSLIDDVGRNMLSQHRTLWGWHSASNAFDNIKLDFRTVVAVNDDFFCMRRLDGDELIVSDNAENLLDQTYAMTEFSHYFILLDAESDASFARAFVKKRASYGWRLTTPCFESVSLGEMERMLNE